MLAQSDIESDEYKRIKRYYDKNAERLRSVKSVTIGVNLNALYQPKEAGIISLNKEEFKSGDLLDRIIKSILSLHVRKSIAVFGKNDQIHAFIAFVKQSQKTFKALFYILLFEGIFGLNQTNFQKVQQYLHS